MNFSKTRELRNDTPIKAIGADTGDNYSLLEVTHFPGGGPPIHSHANEDEGFLILEGIYRFWVGNAEPVDVYPGAHVFGPRGVPHRFQNIGGTPGKILIIFTPAGCEKYFEELAEVRKMGSPDLIEKERAIDLRYGITIERDSS